MSKNREESVLGDLDSEVEYNRALHGVLFDHDKRYAEWYYGACHVLADTKNPTRISQSAQSIREVLEKLPKEKGVLFTTDRASQSTLKQELDELHSRLKPDQFHAEYLVWSKKYSKYYPSKKVRIQNFRVARADPGRQLPEDIDREHLQRWSYFDVQFQNYAHHKVTEPKEEEYRKLLKELEDFLLNQLAPPVTEDFQIITQQIKEFEAAKEVDLISLFKLIKKNTSNYDKFFQTIKSEAWLRPLIEYRFLEAAPKINKQEEITYFPPWVPSIYLTKIADKKSSEVAKILKNVRATHNPIAQQQIVEVVMVMPAQNFEIIDDYVIKWVTNPYARIVDIKLIELAKKYVDQGDFEEAFKLFEKLTQIKQVKLDDFEKVKGIVGDHSYDMVLQDLTDYIFSNKPSETIELLISRLFDVINLQKKPKEERGTKNLIYDYSEIWRPKLSGSQYGYYEVLHLLITHIVQLFNAKKLNEKETDEIVAELLSKRYKIFVRLAVRLLNESPFDSLRKKYSNVIEEVGNPDSSHEIEAGFIESTSPKSAKEFSEMSTDELLEFIYNWKPQKEDFFSFAREDIGQELRNFSEHHSEKALELLNKIDTQHPKFLSEILLGLRLAIDNKRVTYDANELLFTLNRVTHKLLPRLDNSDYDDAFTKIADLYASLADRNAVKLDLGALKEAYAALNSISKHKDPRPKDEEERSDSKRNPYALAINSARGMIISAIIGALKNYVRNSNYDSNKPGAFINNVLKDLEWYLDPEKETTHAIRSVIAHEFPFLYDLSPTWAETNTPRIFPLDAKGSERGLFTTAIETYFETTRPYKDSFIAMKPTIEGYLVKLKGKNDPDTNLVNRIVAFVFIAYLNGWIEIDDSLMQKFLELPAVYLGEAIDFIGRSFKDEEVRKDKELVERAVKYWEERRDSNNLSFEECAYFTFWFKFWYGDIDWLEQQFTLVLKSCNKIHHVYMIGERLFELANTHAEQTARLLLVLVNTQVPENINHLVIENHMLDTIKLLYSSNNPVIKALAQKIIDRMLELGHYGFEDIVD